GSSGGLGGLGFGHPLLEFVNAPGSIDELLLARVEGMTHVANTDDDHRFCGTGLDDVATSATHLRIHILRMYIFFHKRSDTIPPAEQLTSWNCCVTALFSLDLLSFCFYARSAANERPPIWMSSSIVPNASRSLLSIASGLEPKFSAPPAANRSSSPSLKP